MQQTIPSRQSRERLLCMLVSVLGLALIAASVRDIAEIATDTPPVNPIALKAIGQSHDFASPDIATAALCLCGVLIGYSVQRRQAAISAVHRLPARRSQLTPPLRA
jgi:ABC-type Fe3+ transport system permease subunit